MWSRHFIKQALGAIRNHRTVSTVILQNATRSLQHNNRFYATNTDEEIDILFDLGRKSTKTNKKQQQKTASEHTGKSTSQNSRSEANILEAINFSPENRVEQRKNVSRGRGRKHDTDAPSAEDEQNALQAKKDAKVARKKLKSEAPTFKELTLHDAKLNLSYVKLPLNHPQIQSLLLLTRSKKYRAQKHLLMIEGKRLIEEAVEAGLPLRYLFFHEHEKLESITELLHSKYSAEMPKIFRIPQHDLTFWSVMTTCPGLIAIFEKFNDMTDVWKRARDRFIETKTVSGGIDAQITVVCDQIREPNNIGSIIRTCAALPCAQVILMKGCTDPWEPKALRGGCGGQFRVPILGPMEWSSLPSFLPEKSSVFVASNKLEETIDGSMRGQITSKPYSTVPFVRCNHIVLIIGGETEGVSDDAIQFMAETNVEQKLDTDEFGTPENSCIHVPLSNGVESLNSNAATAIMLFEIRKQFNGI